MKSVGVAVVVCALLASLAACGAGASSEAATPAAPIPTTAEATRAVRVRVADGLSVTASTPKVFTPSASAQPRVPRAVGFELLLANEGTTAYRTSLLSMTAVAGGGQLGQVVDATQGYSGIIDTSDLAPGDTRRVSVAFAIAGGDTVRLSVRRDNTGSAVVTVYDGAL